MLHASSPTRQQAHELVDRMSPAQLSAVVSLFESIVRYGHHSPLTAPYTDHSAANQSANALSTNQDREVLAELGLLANDADFWPPPH